MDITNKHHPIKYKPDYTISKDYEQGLYTETKYMTLPNRGDEKLMPVAILDLVSSYRNE